MIKETAADTAKEAGTWNSRPYTADELYDETPAEKADAPEADKEADADTPEEETAAADGGKDVDAEAADGSKDVDAEADDKESASKAAKDDRTVPYKRLSKEVAKRRAAEEEARLLRDQIAETEKNKQNVLTAPQSTATVPEDGLKKPNPDDYDLMEYDPKYLEDRDAWVLAEAERRAEARITTQRERDSQAQAAEAHAKLVKDFVDASHKYEDFDEVWETAELSRISPTLGQAFLEDPVNGVEAAKYLADNDDALEALLAKSPTQQVTWFGQHIAQKQSAVTQASVQEKALQQKSTSVGATKVPRNSASGKKSDRRAFGEMYSPEELYGE